MPGSSKAPAAVLALLAVVPVVLIGTMGVGLLEASSLSGGDTETPVESVAGIPSTYLEAYTHGAAQFELGTDGWSYLAAVGKIESDHGRSPAPGVRSGQNFHGCCAGPMQIHNGFGSGGGTWGAYKIDGDGDGVEDIYDPDDAVATAAHYLKSSGAPAEWRRALFAYNHAGWYVDQVVEQASTYRAEATEAALVAPDMQTAPAAGRWLVEIPGAPKERCDARIVADVVMLIERFGLRLTACYGGYPHATQGEHPLGLAVDVAPANGDWNRTLRLAETYGWSPSCASSGCGGRGPFRVVLYNGYPGHGDPAHSTQPHLHLSWQHAAAKPFTQAPWVRVLLAPGALR